MTFVKQDVAQIESMFPKLKVKLGLYLSNFASGAASRGICIPPEAPAGGDQGPRKILVHLLTDPHAGCGFGICIPPAALAGKDHRWTLLVYIFFVGCESIVVQRGRVCCAVGCQGMSVLIRLVVDVKVCPF